MKIKSSLKKLLPLLALMAVVLPFVALALCQYEEVKQTSEISENPLSLATMQSLYIDCLNQPVIVSNETSIRVALEPSETLKPIYFESPQLIELDESIPKEGLVTFNNLIALQDKLEISISSTPSSNTIDSVFVDTKEVEKAPESMVKESKQWLYSRGMSETDIQEMLTEEGATESELIPFALGYMESDNILLTRVDWYQVVDCGLYALGFDFTGFMFTSGFKTRGKVAIMRAFKCVAQKALDPAGGAIAVIAFAGCMAF